MWRPDELADLVLRLRAARVTCIGDIMLDRFVYGDVNRISPEAPVPVMLVSRESSALGGLGNVAGNLSSLGAHVFAVAVNGQDAEGREIEQLLDELHNCSSCLLKIPKHRSTVKTRFIASGQQLMRLDHEEKVTLSDEDVRYLVQRVIERKLDSVIVLSDYGKGVLAGQSAQHLISAARMAGKYLIVDPKGPDYLRYRGAHLITPNGMELHQATGRSISTSEEVVNACRYLIEQLELEAVVATLSERGLMTVQRDGDAVHIPSEASEVFDVAGAGDTVVATLAAAIAVGIPLIEASYLANKAAGIVVGKVGTAMVSSSELLRALRAEEIEKTEQKIVPTPRAIEKTIAWKRMRERVGFTNGCFDLLHPGHVKLLSQAKAKVDRLVVGLNSDASVKRLKGPERPIQNETSRSMVLASLSSVDLVVTFDEDTPIKLIETLRPDVLIKGADYTISTVVGADFVRSYGGEIVLFDLLPEQSTTRIVKQITGMHIPK